jgi:hypothetical protein
VRTHRADAGLAGEPRELAREKTKSTNQSQLCERDQRLVVRQSQSEANFPGRENPPWRTMKRRTARSLVFVLISFSIGALYGAYGTHWRWDGEIIFANIFLMIGAGIGGLPFVAFILWVIIIIFRKLGLMAQQEEEPEKK